jgi:hypothetical protein
MESRRNHVTINSYFWATLNLVSYVTPDWKEGIGCMVKTLSTNPNNEFSIIESAVTDAVPLFPVFHCAPISSRLISS